MRRHLIDSVTGEIIDISSLQRRPKRIAYNRRRSHPVILDLKIAFALVMLVAALYSL